MWFRNLKMYRINPAWACSAYQLQEALERLQFTLAGALEGMSVGWVQPQPDTGLVYAQGDQWLLALRIEKKLLPASVVNAATRERCRQIEEQQGYRPGRKQTREIREQVTDELLPKAFSVARDTRVWIDMRNCWLVIDTASGAVADVVLGALGKALDPFPLLVLHTEVSPAVAMTNWLVFDEPPPNFSIDQDTELQSNRESAAKVRYQRLSVDLDDVRRHVEAGRTCTRLALTWADRVSFVLTDGLELRRVVPLDVIQHGRQTAETEADQFDSDFALMTGELSLLLGDIVEALGGEKTHEKEEQ